MPINPRMVAAFGDGEWGCNRGPIGTSVSFVRVTMAPQTGNRARLIDIGQVRNRNLPAYIIKVL